MRSTRNTGGAATGALILISALGLGLGLGLSGCSGSVKNAAWKPAEHLSGSGTSPSATGAGFGTAPSQAPSSAAPGFLTDPATALAPPEFRGPAAWSSPVALTTAPLSGFGGTPPETGIPQTKPGVPDSDNALMKEQAAFGMVAVAGNEVAVPEFAGPGGTLTVQFLDAKTGQPLASHPLPDAQQYYGMEPVTVGGKTDVEVRYGQAGTAGATAPPSSGGQFTSVVLDPGGAQVWTSAGRPLSTPQAPTGLLGDRGTGMVHDGGYVVRIDPPAASDRTLSYTTVADLTGRTVLTVPRTNPAPDPIKSTVNNVQVAGGYAVVTTVDVPPTPAATMPIRFTVYDLAHNAKKTATFTESGVANGAGPVFGWGAVLANCGGRLLLEWPTVTTRTTPTGTLANLAVLDAATGQVSSPPVTIPSDAPGPLQTTLQATTDPSCSAALVGGNLGVTQSVLLAMDWAHGKQLWKQANTYPAPKPGPLTIFQPLVAHGGAVYGLRTLGAQTQAAAIGLADGKVRGGGFALSPVAFTAAGTPLFVQLDPAAPPPLTYASVTTPPGATAGQTVTVTARPSAPPTPTPVTQASPSASGGSAMTVWAGSS